MNLSRRLPVPIQFGIAAGLALVASAWLAGCAPSLPEPESADAKLYVQYCSGSGCHSPIPPQTGAQGYWRNQYDRMIEIMRKKSMDLPDAEQDRRIRDYLKRFAE